MIKMQLFYIPLAVHVLNELTKPIIMCWKALTCSTFNPINVSRNYQIQLVSKYLM